MSELAARQALARMNLNVVALAPAYGGAFVADMMNMAKTDPVEAHAKFLELRRAELAAAYGYNDTPQDKPFAFAAGLAFIPITGTLVNRFGGSYGSITGYNFIRQQTALALADSDVKGIVYDVNSYGGEAAGCFECSDFIAAAGQQKPTLAYIDSNAYSAGYALASAANHVVLTPSGGAGSIGVVAMHVDMSKFLDKMGFDVTFIHFGDHKVDGNPFQPLPEDVKKAMQASVNKSGESFVALVARNMSLDPQAVRDTQARTYRADDALSLGLIDAIATPETAVRAFLGELSGSTFQLTTMKEDTSMSAANQPGANQGASGTTSGGTTAAGSTTTAATTTAATTTTASGSEAATGATTTTQTADAGQAAADARTAERARVNGILTCEEAKGREQLAQHFAMSTDMSVDAAKAALAAAPKTNASGNGFNAAMNNSEHPNVGASGGGAGGEAEMSAADRILANHAKATGHKYDAAKK